MQIVAFSERMREIVPDGSKPELLADGLEKTEGPVWHRDRQTLYFTDFGTFRIYQWNASEGLRLFREDSQRAIGMALDAQGRLLCCESLARRVSRIEADGGVSTVASHYQGMRLGSPNDVVVRSDGLVYFTDPRSNYLTDTREIAFNGVYLCDPSSGEVHLLAKDFVWPNGLCFSPDEQTLYINDSSRQQIRAFDVRADGLLEAEREFAVLDTSYGPGGPDGMKTDTAGNVYVTGPGGIWIFEPDGTRVGILLLEKQPLNFAFGGAAGEELYLTAYSALYRLKLGVRGFA